MATARAYRGKYPNRIRSLSFGTSKVWFIESNDGQRVTVTAAQARTIAGVRGPQLGDNIGPYVAMPATLDAIHTGTSDNVAAYRAARDMVRTADDVQLPITISAHADGAPGFRVRDASNPEIRPEFAIVTILPRRYFL